MDGGGNILDNNNDSQAVSRSNVSISSSVQSRINHNRNIASKSSRVSDEEEIDEKPRRKKKLASKKEGSLNLPLINNDNNNDKRQDTPEKQDNDEGDSKLDELPQNETDGRQAPTKSKLKTASNVTGDGIVKPTLPDNKNDTNNNKNVSINQKSCKSNKNKNKEKHRRKGKGGKGNNNHNGNNSKSKSKSSSKSSKTKSPGATGKSNSNKRNNNNKSKRDKSKHTRWDERAPPVAAEPREDDEDECKKIPINFSNHRVKINNPQCTKRPKGYEYPQISMKWEWKLDGKNDTTCEYTIFSKKKSDTIMNRDGKFGTATVGNLVYGRNPKYPRKQYKIIKISDVMYAWGECYWTVQYPLTGHTFQVSNLCFTRCQESRMFTFAYYIYNTIL